MVNNFIYKLYIQLKRRKFIAVQKKNGNIISVHSKGFMNVNYQGENIVPEGCSFSGKVRLGFRTTLGINNMFFGNIIVGKYCQIGANVAFHATNHPINHMTTYINKRLFNGLKDLKTNKEIIIGNDVWVGHGAIVLSGVSIGNGAIIGAGSIVTKNVEPYSIVVGNPAKSIKKRFEDSIIKEIEELQWWNLSDTELEKIKPLFLRNFDNKKSIYDA